MEAFLITFAIVVAVALAFVGIGHLLRYRHTKHMRKPYTVEYFRAARRARRYHP